jgi:cytochrome c
MKRPAAVLAAACVLEALARVALAAPADDEQQIKRGAQLLQKSCAACHAIGKTGDSPQQEAPPFRTLSQRYPIESLEESLGEGIMAGHPDMPEFSFDADEVGAIIDYLNSIQSSPPKK